MPGVTIRNVSEKRLSCGLASLFRACQAINMAMTTVLPEPVAILKAMRYRSGFLASFASRRWFSIQGWLRPAISARKMAVLSASIWQKKSGFSRVRSVQ